MMPLFKYFMIAGGGLLAMLIAISAVTQPGGPGPSLVNAAAPQAAVIRHYPQASRVERLRVEEGALMANAKTESPAMAEPAHLLSTTQADTPQAAEPIGAPTAATEDEAARALQLEKERLRDEGARKKRLARKRAKALEEAASRRQDQMYYGNAALHAAQRRDRRDLATAGPEHRRR